MNSKTAIYFMSQYSDSSSSINYYDNDKSYKFSGILGLLINKLNISVSAFRISFIWSLLSVLFILSMITDIDKNGHLFTNLITFVLSIITLAISSYLLVNYEVNSRKLNNIKDSEFRTFFKVNIPDVDLIVDHYILYNTAKKIVHENHLTLNQEEFLNLFKKRLTQPIKEPL